MVLNVVEVSEDLWRNPIGLANDHDHRRWHFTISTGMEWDRVLLVLVSQRNDCYKCWKLLVSKITKNSKLKNEKIRSKNTFIATDETDTYIRIMILWFWCPKKLNLHRPRVQCLASAIQFRFLLMKLHVPYKFIFQMVFLWTFRTDEWSFVRVPDAYVPNQIAFSLMKFLIT